MKSCREAPGPADSAAPPRLRAPHARRRPRDPRPARGDPRRAAARPPRSPRPPPTARGAASQPPRSAAQPPPALPASRRRAPALTDELAGELGALLGHAGGAARRGCSAARRPSAEPGEHEIRGAGEEGRPCACVCARRRREGGNSPPAPSAPRDRPGGREGHFQGRNRPRPAPRRAGGRAGERAAPAPRLPPSPPRRSLRASRLPPARPRRRRSGQRGRSPHPGPPRSPRESRPPAPTGSIALTEPWRPPPPGQRDPGRPLLPPSPGAAEGLGGHGGHLPAAGGPGRSHPPQGPGRPQTPFCRWFPPLDFKPNGSPAERGGGSLQLPLRRLCRSAALTGFASLQFPLVVRSFKKPLM